MKSFICLILVVISLISCDKMKQDNNQAIKDSVQVFLDNYNISYQLKLKAAQEADWGLNTKIVEGDTISAKMADKYKQELASYTGSKYNIEMSQKYLHMKSALTPLQIKELEVILYNGAGNPETSKKIVIERIATETQQVKDLYGFNLNIDGKPTTANEINKILKEETNLEKRQKAWEASKEVGKKLKDGLEKLQKLRNESVKDLGYSDFFSYQVAEYGMSSKEMMDLCNSMIQDLWPLYRELHTWARYELAKKYKQPVPDYIPAHWLPNRWGQEWQELVNVKGINIDPYLEKKGREWIPRQGEKFYMSLGFDSLPATFWEKSSLYPAPKDANWKKNNHASAWHIDNDKDVRSLMSIEANTEWWSTCLHELGHIYYYKTYSNPNVPIVLRTGANRAYHEAFGTMIGLASLQKNFLIGLDMIPKETKSDSIQTLLKEALEYVILIPWGAGTMTGFENQLYANNLPKDQYNQKWWELVKKYQGIVPPTQRGEEYCDAATKTHINDDPAQYYDYSISTILLFQVHEYIAKNILKQDPHNTNYWGNKEVGNFLKKLMEPGETVDWRKQYKQEIGEDLSAKAMVNYFAPVMIYLKELNKGRSYTLPEKLK